jgi:hypothetical protein
VHDNYPPPFDIDLTARGQRSEHLIVISADSIDWRDALERSDGLRSADVAGVKDQIDAPQDFKEALGKPVDEFRAVGVSDHSDACGQGLEFLPKTGGILGTI